MIELRYKQLTKLAWNLLKFYPPYSYTYGKNYYYIKDAPEGYVWVLGSTTNAIFKQKPKGREDGPAFQYQQYSI